MKDLIGNILMEGDKVAVAPKNYRGLVVARVVKFTPQQVRVEYKRAGFTEPEQYLVYPNAVVKLPVA